MNTVCARFFVLGLLLAAAPSALAAGRDPVVASVNGVEIRQSAVDEFRRTLPPQMGPVPDDALIDVVINNQVVWDAAKKEGVDKDAEVRQALRQAEQKLVRQAYVSKKIRARLTDDMVRKRYEQYIASFRPEDEVRARHVVTETEAEAKAVIADLRGGADFATVAVAKSKDPSVKQNGGDLGYFTKDEMVEPFSDAAFSMKPGELSAKPVQSKFGWHVIRVDDRRVSSAPQFDDVKQALRDQMAQGIAEEVVKGLRDKAKIVRFDDNGKPVP